MKQIDILTNTGTVLTRLRKQRTELSQRNFALEIGMAYSVYNRHEKGHTLLDLSYINRYAEYYGMTISELVAMIETPVGGGKLQKKIEQLTQENLALQRAVAGKGFVEHG